METFRHVVLPLARPGITAATIVVFTISVANFSIPDLLGGGFRTDHHCLTAFESFDFVFLV